MKDTVTSKLERLHQIIGGYENVAIAVSGGVDSTFLAKNACEVLGKDKVVAIFVDSILQPAGEKEHVTAIAAEIDCKLLTLHVDPFAVPQFSENPSNRCYFCKKTIYSIIKQTLSDANEPVLMDGTNYDDLDDIRPGLRALQELKIITPLAEAELTKADIRSLSREKGLSSWNRPSGSCLATRIPSGTPITPELLKKIDDCEKHLQAMNFLGCRVRLQDNNALVELASGDKDKFADPLVEQSITEYFIAQGFDAVYLSSVER